MMLVFVLCAFAVLVLDGTIADTVVLKFARSDVTSGIMPENRGDNKSLVGIKLWDPDGMDDEDVCEEDSVQAVWLTKGHQAVLLAKTEKIDVLFGVNIMQCSIMFGPKSSEALQYISIKFDSFYINDASCDARLLVQQSPASFYDRDVTEMADLSCGSINPGTLQTNKGNNVKFTFSRQLEYTRDYNFKINVSLTAGPPEKSGLSFGIKIGIAVISVAAFITLLIIVIKTIRLKCDMKDMGDLPAQNQQVGSSLHSLSERSRPRTRTNSYTVLPQGNPTATEHIPDNGHVQSNRDDFVDYLRVSPNVVYGPMSPDFNIMSPPSYEDSESQPLPPAYDEALSMPKYAGPNEDEPSYINIGSVTKNS